MSARAHAHTHAHTGVGEGGFKNKKHKKEADLGMMPVCWRKAGAWLWSLSVEALWGCLCVSLQAALADYTLPSEVVHSPSVRTCTRLQCCRREQELDLLSLLTVF